MSRSGGTVDRSGDHRSDDHRSGGRRFGVHRKVIGFSRPLSYIQIMSFQKELGGCHFRLWMMLWANIHQMTVSLRQICA